MRSTTPAWSRTLSHHHARNAYPPVYARDFAYANSSRVVLAHPMRAQRACISGASAHTFAEYMAHFLGTPSRSRLWFVSAHSCHGMDEAKQLHKRLLAGPTVDIYVGPERRHWALHRNLLCHHSSYFETEFQGHEVPRGGGTKSGENQLELPCDDPRGFELLVKWLYQGQLEVLEQGTDEAKYDYAVACHKLYLLCDKFDMIRLKNLAMDQYRRGLNEAQLVPDADEINEIYRDSPSGSPFRRLMVKIAARQIMDPEGERDAESYRKCFDNNAVFAVEMVNAIRSMSAGMLFADPTANTQCEYHDHRDGSTCQAHSQGKETAKSKAVVNGEGSILSPSPAAARRHSPAELSAERRTPRKLDIRNHQASPTPRRNRSRKGAVSDNHARASPKVLGNGVAAQPTAIAESTVAGDEPAVDECVPVPVAKTVLGKRRAAVPANTTCASRPPLSPKGQRKLSSVNGIVQHLNGVNDASSVSPPTNQPAASEVPVRKVAGPPKLRQVSAVGP
ncbi:hypothetical protein LTR08_001989 [Meristemomyces frigidus]|nr:hypothetical protein LTR08_001989 [Meristemomyces frigidus]